jgi:hypothetical protein
MDDDEGEEVEIDVEVFGPAELAGEIEIDVDEANPHASSMELLLMAEDGDPLVVVLSSNAMRKVLDALTASKEDFPAIFLVQ